MKQAKQITVVSVTASMLAMASDLASRVNRRLSPPTAGHPQVDPHADATTVRTLLRFSPTGTAGWRCFRTTASRKC